MGGDGKEVEEEEAEAETAVAAEEEVRSCFPAEEVTLINESLATLALFLTHAPPLVPSP